MTPDTTRIGAAYERMHTRRDQRSAYYVLCGVGVACAAAFALWLGWTLERTWTAINRDLVAASETIMEE